MPLCLASHEGIVASLSLVMSRRTIGDPTKLVVELADLSTQLKVSRKRRGQLMWCQTAQSSHRPLDNVGCLNACSLLPAPFIVYLNCIGPQPSLPSSYPILQAHQAMIAQDGSIYLHGRQLLRPPRQTSQGLGAVPDLASPLLLSSESLQRERRTGLCSWG